MITKPSSTSPITRDGQAKRGSFEITIGDYTYPVQTADVNQAPSSREVLRNHKSKVIAVDHVGDLENFSGSTVFPTATHPFLKAGDAFQTDAINGVMTWYYVVNPKISFSETYTKQTFEAHTTIDNATPTA